MDALIFLIKFDLMIRAEIRSVKSRSMRLCVSQVWFLSSDFPSVVGPISQHCMALYLVARAVALIVRRPQVRELV